MIARVIGSKNDFDCDFSQVGLKFLVAIVSPGEPFRVARLLRDADAFWKAKAIREYVQAIRLTSWQGETLPNSELDAWAQWALAQADRIDPANGKAFLQSMDDEAQ